MRPTGRRITGQSATIWTRSFVLDPHMGVGCGLLGAKLLYYITIWRRSCGSPQAAGHCRRFRGVRGIIGGIAAGYVYCRVRKIDFLRYLDLVVPVGGPGPGLWADRLFSGRLLLRGGLRRAVFRHLYQSDYAPTAWPCFPPSWYPAAWISSFLPSLLSG